MASTRPTVTFSSDIESSDYLSFGSIHVRAFAASNPAKDRLCHPVHLRPSTQRRAEFNAHRRRKAASSEPDLICVKALIDGRIAGVANWYRPVDRTSTGGDPLPREVEEDERRAKAQEGAERPEIELEMERCVDAAFASALGDELDRLRKDWTRGRRHWYLSLVVVDPDMGGHGVGSALLQWGLDRATDDGLPCFLEASESGRPLYERRGFRVVNGFEMDDPSAADGKLRIPGMAWGDFRED